MKTDEEATDRNLKKNMKAAFQILHGSLAPITNQQHTLINSVLLGIYLDTLKIDIEKLKFLKQPIVMREPDSAQ